MRIGTRVACLCLAVPLLAGMMSAAFAEPLKIRVGWVLLTSSPVPLLLEKKDILHHYGKTYVVEPQHVRSTTATMTALGSGRMDIGTLAFSTIGFAIENAHLDDIRIITGVLEDGTGDHGTGKFVVLKDSPIRKVEDLKGKVIASLSRGGAVDIAIRAMLRKHGLDDRRDVQIVEVPFPHMKATLVGGKAALVATAPPFSEDPEFLKASRVLFTQKEAMGPTQLLVWVARTGFLEKNRAAVTDFLEDCLTLTRWLTDPKNHKEAVELVARTMKRPAKSMMGWLFTDKDMYRDPNGLPNLPVLQANIELQRKLGFLGSDIDLKRYTDLSYVKAAAAALDGKPAR